MRIEKCVVSVMGWVPQRARCILLGNRSAPRRLSRVIHTVLNLLPVSRYPVLDCQGPLTGFRMRLDWKNHRTFAYGNWEPEVVEAISQCVQQGMTTFDVGAQSGFYSLLLSRLVGRGGSVIAFEPLPANLRILKENVEINTLANVVVRGEAVAEKSGTLDFQVPALNSNLLAGPLAPGDQYPTTLVRSVSLDDFVDEIGCRVDFIKVDVEGAEGAVLDGARRLLRKYHPTMMIELHNMDGKSRIHEVATRLQELGYHLHWLGEISWTAHILARWAGA